MSTVPGFTTATLPLDDAHLLWATEPGGGAGRDRKVTARELVKGGLPGALTDLTPGTVAATDTLALLQGGSEISGTPVGVVGAGHAGAVGAMGAASALDGTETVAIVQGGASKKVTTAALAAYAMESEAIPRTGATSFRWEGAGGGGPGTYTDSDDSSDQYLGAGKTPPSALLLGPDNAVATYNMISFVATLTIAAISSSSDPVQLVCTDVSNPLMAKLAARLQAMGVAPASYSPVLSCTIRGIGAGGGNIRNTYAMEITGTATEITLTVLDNGNVNGQMLWSELLTTWASATYIQLSIHAPFALMP